VSELDKMHMVILWIDIFILFRFDTVHCCSLIFVWLC